MIEVETLGYFVAICPNCHVAGHKMKAIKSEYDLTYETECCECGIVYSLPDCFEPDKSKLTPIGELVSLAEFMKSSLK